MLRLRQLSKLFKATTYNNKSPKYELYSQFTLYQLPQRTFNNSHISEQSEDEIDILSNNDKRSLSRQSQQSINQEQKLDAMFMNRYGQVKSKLFDQWLELDSKALISECKRLKIAHSEKHIENIQKLFDHVKKTEAEFIKELQNLSSSHLNTRDSQESKNSGSNSFQMRVNTGIFAEKKKQVSEVSHGDQKTQHKQESVDKKDYSQSHQKTQNTILESNWHKDVSQAKQSLNEHLANILRKRKQIEEERDQILTQASNQQEKLSQRKQALQEIEQIAEGEEAAEIQTNPQKNINQSPFKHSFTKLRQNLFQRRNFIEIHQPNAMAKKHQYLKEILMDKIQSQPWSNQNNIDQKLEKILQALNSKNKVFSDVFEGFTQDQNAKFNKVPLIQQIRKQLTSQNLKNVEFYDKLELLKAFPKVEELPASQRAAHYILLNDILSSDNQDYWYQLDKDNIFMIIDKCHEILNYRDIQNKLKSQLQNIQTHTFNIDDLLNLAKKLTEGDKPGQMDIRIIVNSIIKRNFKTCFQVPNQKELSKYLDFFEYIYKNCPLAFASANTELKMLFYRVKALENKQLISKNDHLRMLKLFFPHYFTPNYQKLYLVRASNIEIDPETGEQIPISSNFKDFKNKDDLYEYIDLNMLRIEESLYTFDHLNNSNSKYHKNFKGYTGRSMATMRQILLDLVHQERNENELIDEKDMKIAIRLFSNEITLKNAFLNYDELLQVADKLTKNLLYTSEINLEKYKQQAEGAGVSQILPEPSKFLDWKYRIQFIQNLTKVLNEEIILLPRVSALADCILEQMSKEFYHFQHFSLEEIFKLNKEGLKLLDLIKQLKLEKLSHKDYDLKYQRIMKPIRDIVKSSVYYHYLGENPKIEGFKTQIVDLQLAKKIEKEASSTFLNKNIDSVIAMINQLNNEEGKDLAEKVIRSAKTFRILKSEDLLSLFKMIDKFGLTEKAQSTLMLISTNLLTITFPRIDNESKDSNFNKLNDLIESQELEIKKWITNIYLNLHTHYSATEDFNEHKKLASFSSLSKFMADIFDEFNHEELIKIFELLGPDHVENYHEDFIEGLYEKYSQQTLIDSMAAMNQKFFFKFAKAWPHFLRNNSILNQLLNMKALSALPKQQSEILTILSQQRILLPKLMGQHFDTFIKLKDKEIVQDLMKDFLHCASYLGFSDFDVEKFVAVFRRIHQSPEKLQDSKQILDLLVVLALSNKYYKDFEQKNKDFIESCLEFIENQHVGIENLTLKDPDNPIDGDPINIKYYKSIPSTDKIYQKILLPEKVKSFSLQQEVNLLQTKTYNEEEKEEEEEVEQGENSIESELQQLLKNVDPQSMIQTLKLNELETVTEEDKQIQFTDEDQEIVKFIFRHDIPYVSHQTMVQIHKKLQKLDYTLKYFKTLVEFDQIKLEAAQPFKDENNSEEIEEDSKTEKNVEKEEEDIKGGPQPIEQFLSKKYKDGKQMQLHAYDRKASESNYSEELEFHQYRKKKFAEMDRKSKHLLIFSNINHMDFVDINKSEIARAWGVLFHFRNKTFDSILYDEFESLALRNAMGKSRGHELFSQFYIKLVEKSQQLNFKIQAGAKCEKSGWPIDLLLSIKRMPTTKSGQGFTKKLALFFLLQEELSQESLTQQFHPLGLQQLMIKHLSTFSDFQGLVVTEKDFYASKGKIEDYIDEILQGIGLNG